jgi:hypothetical protein
MWPSAASALASRSLPKWGAATVDPPLSAQGTGAGLRTAALVAVAAAAEAKKLQSVRGGALVGIFAAALALP